jgi:hypothetical protein
MRGADATADGRAHVPVALPHIALVHETPQNGATLAF